MERHIKLSVSIDHESCSSVLNTGSEIWKNPSGELNIQRYAGTTFFYLSTKAAVGVPVGIAIEAQEPYLFFLWNAQQTAAWQPVGTPAHIPVKAYAFQGTVLYPGTSFLHFAEKTANIQCFGFSPNGAELLVEEFDELAPLVTALSVRSELSPPSCPVRFMTPMAYKCIDELRKTSRRGFSLNIQLKETLYQLVKLYVESLRTLAVKRSVLDDDGLYERAVALIQERFTDPEFNVEGLVEMLGLSRSNLYRLFEGQGQPSPYRHILTTRLDKARELRKTTPLPINEIMAIVGFNNAAHFTLQYKTHFGVTPSEDR